MRSPVQSWVPLQESTAERCVFFVYSRLAARMACVEKNESPTGMSRIVVNASLFLPSSVYAGSFKGLGNIYYEVTHLFQFIHYVHIIDTCLVILA